MNAVNVLYIVSVQIVIVYLILILFVQYLKVLQYFSFFYTYLIHGKIDCKNKTNIIFIKILSNKPIKTIQFTPTLPLFN